ncbi:MAG: Ppx/GppA phosphatase family protein [Acidimicrobiales bacterium]
MNLAAIDVGTNSLHLVVARVVDDRHFEVIGAEKEMVRLGTGSGDMKRLDTAAMDRGIAALARFRRIADIHDAPVRAVATSAVREAENHDEFLARARTEAGVEVEVISGVEEARLIHLGVLQALPVFTKRSLICDIGGGSTEVMVGEHGELLSARSFKLGAVRLTNRFFPGERLHPAAVQACRTFVRSALVPLAHEVHRLGFEVAIGSSGTIEAIARLAHASAGQEELRTYNGFRFDASALASVVRQLVATRTVAERAALPGMEAKRADIILAGALILEGVAEVFGVSTWTVSEYALREGVLLDTVQRTRGGTLHHLREVSRNGVLALARSCDDEHEHGAQVARLALALFDATVGIHGLDEGCREYLEAGALLANVGLFVSHTKHHLHSYYVIRNSDRLVGFTDAEIEMIAQIARYHRKSAPKATHAEFAALGLGDQRVVRILAGLLRVAIGLDRSHENLIAGLTAYDDGEELVVEVTPAGALDVSLELYAASERRSLLEDALGRRIRLTVGVARASVPADHP